eukprot:1394509-Amphidinium_carterae.1
MVDWKMSMLRHTQCWSSSGRIYQVRVRMREQKTSGGGAWANWGSWNLERATGNGVIWAEGVGETRR